MCAAGPQHDHNIAPTHLHETDAGNDHRSDLFSETYELNNIAQFDLNCVACCLVFLTTQRNYSSGEGSIDRVKYGDAIGQNWTDCYLTRKRKHGQFQTGDDLQIGVPHYKRLLGNGITYQLYQTVGQQPDILSVGVPVTARIQSIAVNENHLTRERIMGCKLNYHNAALLELQRKKQGLPSLLGRCEHRRPQQQQQQQHHHHQQEQQDDEEEREHKEEDTEEVTEVESEEDTEEKDSSKYMEQQQSDIIEGVEKLSMKNKQ